MSIQPLHVISGGHGAGVGVQALPGLTADEQALCQELLRTNGRLEPEQLPAAYAAAALRDVGAQTL